MKRSLRGLSLVFGSFSIIACLSFGYSDTLAPAPIANIPVKAITFTPATTFIPSLYDSLGLGYSGLSREAYDYAITGMGELEALGKLSNDSIVTICDFSLASSEKRMFVLDLRNYRVLFNTWVAHGRNSGKENAESFSNTLSSFKTSLGFYRTGDTYIGGNGYSLKLHGLEAGINDKALERAIVLHGADYVSPAFLHARGFMGRSYGCPAVPLREVKPIINTIKGGSCLFIYSPKADYLSHSTLLRGNGLI